MFNLNKSPLSIIGIFIAVSVFLAVLPIGSGFKRLIIIIGFIIMIKSLISVGASMRYNERNK